MKYFRSKALILYFTFILSACSKEVLNTSDCDSLRQGLVDENLTFVSKSVGDLLTFHTQENLNKLSETLSDRCNITTTGSCFNCIYTDPAISEIKLSFTHSGVSFEKVIDISSTKENKMKIVDIHN